MTDCARNPPNGTRSKLNHSAGPHQKKTVDDWVMELTSEGREELSNEINALAAIFCSQSISCYYTATSDHDSKTFTISIIGSFSPDNSEAHEEIPLSIEIIIPDDYPQCSPPRFRLVSKYLGAHRVDAELYKQVSELYQDGKNWCPSEPVLFDAIESIRELATKYYHTKAEDQLASQRLRDVTLGTDVQVSDSELPKDDELIERTPTLSPKPNQIFTIFTSEPIMDRKSVFVGHATSLNDPHLVPSIMDQILSDKKVARAAHNMYAWRCELNGHLHQDNDDDGESAAGSRMQHLLNILDVKNVFVCVSRWFGGIHLGPDRFKHINQATRDALLAGQFIPTPASAIGRDDPTDSKSHRTERKKR
ncbi:hypothetical protein CROQUDRAFT_658984 [Cronartium quercuum f. sp. fusiforme G11]|uniref:RWD domain-containing protein n=1 Tax=Cronartium quercuum f. sp. fusiforme G11 TaxID=708437 RepID=A0A9P6TAH3_9BASI|nr:hypothetical protein CROQUDRAFT_658984 [Cronartium quercuum f. sp. fusiforme G11]